MELLEIGGYLRALDISIGLSMLRRMTAESFNEKWDTADDEFERLELGRVLTWDAPEFDDFEECA